LATFADNGSAFLASAATLASSFASTSAILAYFTFASLIAAVMTLAPAGSSGPSPRAAFGSGVCFFGYENIGGVPIISLLDSGCGSPPSTAERYTD